MNGSRSPLATRLLQISTAALALAASCERRQPPVPPPPPAPAASSPTASPPAAPAPRDAEPAVPPAEAMKRAADLQTQIDRQRAQGDYAAAAQTADMLVNAQTQAHGAAFFSVADARRLSAELLKMASLPEADRSELAKADAAEQRIPQLFSDNDWEDSLNAARQTHSIRQRLLAKDSPELLRASAWVDAIELATRRPDTRRPDTTHDSVADRWPRPAEPRDVLLIDIDNTPGLATADMPQLTPARLREMLDAGPTAYAMLATTDTLHRSGRYAEIADLLDVLKTTPPTPADYNATARAARGDLFKKDGDQFFEIAVMASSQARFAEWDALARKLVDTDKAAFGTNHPAYAASLSLCARLRLWAGRPHDAQLLEGEALRIRAASLPAGHPDVQRSLATAAFYTFMTGDAADAKPMWAAAQQGYATLAKDGDLVFLLPSILKFAPEPLADRALQQALLATPPAPPPAAAPPTAAAEPVPSSKIEPATPVASGGEGIVQLMRQRGKEMFLSTMPRAAEMSDKQQQFLVSAQQLGIYKQMRTAVADGDVSPISTNVREAEITRLRAELFGDPPPADESGDIARINEAINRMKLPGFDNLAAWNALQMKIGGDVDDNPDVMKRLLESSMMEFLATGIDRAEARAHTRVLTAKAENQLAEASYGPAEETLLQATALARRAGFTGDDAMLQPIVRLAWLRYARGRLAEAETLYREAIAQLGNGASYSRWAAAAFDGLIRVLEEREDFAAAAEARRDRADAVRERPPAVANPFALQPAARPWRDWRRELDELEAKGPADPAPAAAPKQEAKDPFKEQVDKIMQQFEFMPAEQRKQMRKQVEKMVKNQPGLPNMGPLGDLNDDTPARPTDRRAFLRAQLEEYRADELADDARLALNRGDAKTAEDKFRQAAAAVRDNDRDEDLGGAFVDIAGARATRSVCLAGLHDALEAQQRWSEAADAWLDSVKSHGRHDHIKPRPAEAHGRAAALLARAGRLNEAETESNLALSAAHDALRAENLQPSVDEIVRTLESDKEGVAGDRADAIRDFALAKEAQAYLAAARKQTADAVSALTEAARLHLASADNHAFTRFGQAGQDPEIKKAVGDDPIGKMIDIQRMMEQMGQSFQNTPMLGLKPDDCRRDACTDYIELARLYTEAGTPADAAKAYSQAIALARRIEDPRLWHIAARYADCLRTSGRPDDSIPLYVEATDVRAALHQTGPGDQMRRATADSADRQLSDPVRGQIRARVAAAAPTPAEINRAISCVERSRGRMLLDLVARSGSDPLTSLALRATREADPALATRAQTALDKRTKALRAVEAVEAKIAAVRLDDRTPDPELLGSQTAALSCLVDADAEIAKLAGAAGIRRGLRPMTAAEIGSALRPGELLLIYDVADDSTLLFVIPAGSAASAREIRQPTAPVTAADLAGWSTAFIHTIYRGSRLSANELAAGEQTSLRLAAALLPDDVREQIARAKRVFVVADGALHGIPFDALPLAANPGSDPRRWIDALPPVVQGVSATAILQSRSHPAEDAGSTGCVILGNPLFDEPHKPLPGTQREAEAVSAIAQRAGPPFTPVVTLTQSRASRHELEQAIAGRRMVHLATHGRKAAEAVDSALVLAPSSAGGDSQLRLRDLLGDWGGRLRHTDLVVLSACETAEGSAQADEGLISLPWGFLYAGAESVMATLWRVPDDTTDAFMSRFYENLTGAFTDARQVAKVGYPARRPMPKAEALAEAKAWIRAGRGESATPSEPYFWGAFVLVGDPD